MRNLKSGTYITLFNGLRYLFLGYSDYKRSIAIGADFDGDRIEIFTNQIKETSL